MTIRLAAFAAGIGVFALVTPAFADPGRIDAYVTPYYDSRGPVIHAGPYSAGLASSNTQTFVATIHKMERNRSNLNFVELYVAAIRLYDFGYRNEATYWFYSAQYAGRLFAATIDQRHMGSIGSRGFELYQAQNAFFELAGPDINGWAFGNLDAVVGVIHRVQRDNRDVPNLRGIYPGVTFVDPGQWKAKNAELNAGLGQLGTQMSAQKRSLAQERQRNGTAARFAHLSSREFPGS